MYSYELLTLGYIIMHTILASIIHTHSLLLNTVLRRSLYQCNFRLAMHNIHTTLVCIYNMHS